MTATRNIGMPVHTAQVPDYATCVYHNMTTSLPVFSILYPSIRRYTVKQTRKSETSVDGQSLERKGGPLLNLLVSVKRVIRTPLFLRWYEALSVVLYSIGESITFTPKMVKGKKADAPIQTDVGSLAPQPPSANETEKELDDTPPPSRPPSPPPSRPPSPTYSARSRSSEWSIDVEELSDEPRPAIQSRKKKTQRERPRSSSWSRSLVNSFRKKKKDKELKREQLYKTEPLPADFSTKVEEDLAVENEIKVILRAVQPEEEQYVEIEEILEEIETPGSIEGETVTTPEAIAKAPERNNRMSRILSFGTFGRRKSLQVQQEQVKDDNLNSGIQEYPEMKEPEKEKKRQVEEKTEVEMKGKNDESDCESGESKPQSKRKLKEKVKSEKKPKDSQKEKAEENVGVTPSDAESESSPKITKLNGKEKRKSIKTKSKQKSIFSFRSSSKTIDQVKPEVDTNTEQLNEEQSIAHELQPPESVKPKRRTIANFFKREKSIKDETPATPASDVINSKKDTKFRSSFARLKKTKSVDAEASPTEDTIEKNRISKRSTSLAFGSSFSIKKMFQSDSQPASLERGTVSPGILVKRGKGSTTNRPKSVQLDEHPLEIEHAPAASQTELRSSRSKLGERFISFTRDSLRIKKKSKSVDHNATEINGEGLQVPIESDEQNVTNNETTTVELEGMRTSVTEMLANAEFKLETEVSKEAATPSTLHPDYEPKHGILRAWFRMLLLSCLHESINRLLSDFAFCFVCILCLISFGFLAAASFT